MTRGAMTAILFLGALLCGCGSGDLPSTPAVPPAPLPTPTPAPNYDGLWRGSTSQGTTSTISFRVSGNQVTALAWDFSAARPGCETRVFCLTIDSACAPLTPPAQIADGRYTVTVATSSVDFTWRGTFGSLTSASGQADFTIHGRCGDLSGSVTWTAANQ